MKIIVPFRNSGISPKNECFCLLDILVLLRKNAIFFPTNIKVFVFVIETDCVQCHDGCINWIFIYYLKRLHMVMAQAVSRWSFTEEAQIQSRTSPVTFVMVKVATGDFCIRMFQFLLSIIPLMLLTNLQFNVVLIKRRGEAWGPSNIDFFFSDVLDNWTERYYHTAFSYSQRISKFRRFIISLKIIQQAT
jgi:hypothetical protein